MDLIFKTSKVNPVQSILPSIIIKPTFVTKLRIVSHHWFQAGENEIISSHLLETARGHFFIIIDKKNYMMLQMPPA